MIMKQNIIRSLAAAALCLCSLFFIGASSSHSESYLLTFAGDCTFGCDQPMQGTPLTFQDIVKDDYAFPFRNVVSFFENDDFTMVNLEGVLKDDGYSSKKGFAFRGPERYVNILTQNSVEAVTIANNHTWDYGQDGYDNTKRILTDAGVSFVEDNGFAMFTTERGLTIGLYGLTLTQGVANYGDTMDLAKMQRDIAAMREQGAQVIIAALHWGQEIRYHPLIQQSELAHRMIDFGVDIVYGSHPHVLQPVEQYGNGVIFYSLGNFSFGGHPWPEDSDTVVIQQQVVCDETGTHLGKLTLIPACVSSTGTGANNFQPTPYEVDSPEYLRTMTKLDGTFHW